MLQPSVSSTTKDHHYICIRVKDNENIQRLSNGVSVTQDHDWKISLWNQSISTISRLSDDLVIPMGDATMPSSVVYTFPLPIVNDEDEEENGQLRARAAPTTKYTTLLLNIECVNRSTGVPTASGVVYITTVNGQDFHYSNGEALLGMGMARRMYTAGSGSGSGSREEVPFVKMLHEKTFSVQLVTNDNIRHYWQGQGGIGERTAEQTAAAATAAATATATYQTAPSIEFTAEMLLVQSLYDDPALLTRQVLERFPDTGTNDFSVCAIPEYGLPLEDTAIVFQKLYLTVEDIQLAADITELYADWHVIVKAGAIMLPMTRPPGNSSSKYSSSSSGKSITAMENEDLLLLKLIEPTCSSFCCETAASGGQFLGTVFQQEGQWSQQCELCVNTDQVVGAGQSSSSSSLSASAGKDDTFIGDTEIGVVITISIVDAFKFNEEKPGSRQEVQENLVCSGVLTEKSRVCRRLNASTRASEKGAIPPTYQCQGKGYDGHHSHSHSHSHSHDPASPQNCTSATILGGDEYEVLLYATHTHTHTHSSDAELASLAAATAPAAASSATTFVGKISLSVESFFGLHLTNRAQPWVTSPSCRNPVPVSNKSSGASLRHSARSYVSNPYSPILRRQCSRLPVDLDPASNWSPAVMLVREQNQVNKIALEQLRLHRGSTATIIDCLGGLCSIGWNLQSLNETTDIYENMTSLPKYSVDGAKEYFSRLMATTDALLILLDSSMQSSNAQYAQLAQTLLLHEWDMVIVICRLLCQKIQDFLASDVCQCLILASENATPASALSAIRGDVAPAIVSIRLISAISITSRQRSSLQQSDSHLFSDGLSSELVREVTEDVMITLMRSGAVVAANVEMEILKVFGRMTSSCGSSSSSSSSGARDSPCSSGEKTSHRGPSSTTKEDSAAGLMSSYLGDDADNATLSAQNNSISRMDRCHDRCSLAVSDMFGALFKNMEDVWALCNSITELSVDLESVLIGYLQSFATFAHGIQALYVSKKVQMESRHMIKLLSNLLRIGLFFLGFETKRNSTRLYRYTHTPGSSSLSGAGPAAGTGTDSKTAHSCCSIVEGMLLVIRSCAWYTNEHYFFPASPESAPSSSLSPVVDYSQSRALFINTVQSFVLTISGALSKVAKQFGFHLAYRMTTTGIHSKQQQQQRLPSACMDRTIYYQAIDSKTNHNVANAFHWEFDSSLFSHFSDDEHNGNDYSTISSFAEMGELPRHRRRQNDANKKVLSTASAKSFPEGAKMTVDLGDDDGVHFRENSNIPLYSGETVLEYALQNKVYIQFLIEVGGLVNKVQTNIVLKQRNGDDGCSRNSSINSDGTAAGVESELHSPLGQLHTTVVSGSPGSAAATRTPPDSFTASCVAHCSHLLCRLQQDILMSLLKGKSDFNLLLSKRIFDAVSTKQSDSFLGLSWVIKFLLYNLSTESSNYSDFLFFETMTKHTLSLTAENSHSITIATLRFVHYLQSQCALLDSFGNVLSTTDSCNSSQVFPSQYRYFKERSLLEATAAARRREGGTVSEGSVSGAAAATFQLASNAVTSSSFKNTELIFESWISTKVTLHHGLRHVISTNIVAICDLRRELQNMGRTREDSPHPHREDAVDTDEMSTRQETLFAALKSSCVSVQRLVRTLCRNLVPRASPAGTGVRQEHLPVLLEVLSRLSGAAVSTLPHAAGIDDIDGIVSYDLCDDLPCDGWGGSGSCDGKISSHNVIGDLLNLLMQLPRGNLVLRGGGGGGGERNDGRDVDRRKSPSKSAALSLCHLLDSSRKEIINTILDILSALSLSDTLSAVSAPTSDQLKSCTSNSNSNSNTGECFKTPHLLTLEEESHVRLRQWIDDGLRHCLLTAAAAAAGTSHFCVATESFMKKYLLQRVPSSQQCIHRGGVGEGEGLTNQNGNCTVGGPRSYINAMYKMDSDYRYADDVKKGKEDGHCLQFTSGMELFAAILCERRCFENSSLSTNRLFHSTLMRVSSIKFVLSSLLSRSSENTQHQNKNGNECVRGSIIVGGVLQKAIQAAALAQIVCHNWEQGLLYFHPASTSRKGARGTTRTQEIDEKCMQISALLDELQQLTTSCKYINNMNNNQRQQLHERGASLTSSSSFENLFGTPGFMLMNALLRIKINVATRAHQHAQDHQQQSKADAPDNNNINVAVTRAHRQFRDIEREICHIRNALKYALISGRWELGLRIATIYLEKYSAATATLQSESNRAIKGAALNSVVSSAQTTPTVTVTMATTPNSRVAAQWRRAPASAEVGAVAAAAVTSPIRRSAVHAEFARSLDIFSQKLKCDSNLRLPPIFYCIRFVSQLPFEHTASEQISAVFDSWCIEQYNMSSRRIWEASHCETTEGQKQQHQIFEHWIVIRFDASSFASNADSFYDSVLAETSTSTGRQQDAQRRDSSSTSSGGKRGTGTGTTDCENMDGSTLLSPLSYQRVLLELIRSFPDYQVVSSQVEIDPAALSNCSSKYKRTDSHPQGNSSTRKRNVKFVQLFEALPVVSGTSTTVKHVSYNKRSNYNNDNNHYSFNSTMNSEEEAAGDHQSSFSFTKFNIFSRVVNSNATLRSTSSTTSSRHGGGGGGDYTTVATSSFGARTTEHCGSNTSSGVKYVSRRTISVDPTEGSAGLNTNEQNTRSTPASSSGAANNNNNQQSSDPIDAFVSTKIHPFDLCPLSFGVCIDCDQLAAIESTFEALSASEQILHQVLSALTQLNSFSVVEISKEQLGTVVSSDTVFFGAYSILSNVLACPNVSTFGIMNAQTVVASEKERLELEWQAFRKQAKKVHLQNLEAAEEKHQQQGSRSLLQQHSRSASSCSSSMHKSSPGTVRFKSPTKVALPPTDPRAELDFGALRNAFESKDDFKLLAKLETLSSVVTSTITAILQEMRKFVLKARETHEEKTGGGGGGLTSTPTCRIQTAEQLRDLAARKGRRPTVMSYALQNIQHAKIGQQASDGGDTFLDCDQVSIGTPRAAGDPLEHASSLIEAKLKMCLYLESLYSTSELGILV